MKSVKIAVKALLEKMEQNLIKHKEDYKEALLGWHIEIQNWAKQRSEQFTALLPDALDKFEIEITDRYVPSKPTSYANEYEKVIEMLKWSTDKEIELPAHEFEQYVMDKWDWSGNFKTTTMAYSNNIRKA